MNINSIEAGIDYFSATCLNDAKVASRGFVTASSFLTDLARNGYGQIKNQSIRDYRGIYMSGAFVGMNKETMFAYASGKLSRAFAEYIYHEDVHVTRIDLQITAYLKHDDINKFVNSCYEEARKSQQSGKSRKITLQMFIENEGGRTMYLGSPKSEVRGRIYNKSAQMMDTSKNMLRFEMQYRSPYAQSICAAISDVRDELDKAKLISATVVDWFMSHGVDTLPKVDISNPITIDTKDYGTDVEKQLAWLTKQVRPTVKVLTEIGRITEVLTALGLTTEIVLSSLPEQEVFNHLVHTRNYPINRRNFKK